MSQFLSKLSTTRSYNTAHSHSLSLISNFTNGISNPLTYWFCWWSTSAFKGSDQSYHSELFQWVGTKLLFHPCVRSRAQFKFVSDWMGRTNRLDCHACSKQRNTFLASGQSCDQLWLTPHGPRLFSMIFSLYNDSWNAWNDEHVNLILKR